MEQFSVILVPGMRVHRESLLTAFDSIVARGSANLNISDRIMIIPFQRLLVNSLFLFLIVDEVL